MAVGRLAEEGLSDRREGRQSSVVCHRNLVSGPPFLCPHQTLPLLLVEDRHDGVVVVGNNPREEVPYAVVGEGRVSLVEVDDEPTMGVATAAQGIDQRVAALEESVTEYDISLKAVGRGTDGTVGISQLGAAAEGASAKEQEEGICPLDGGRDRVRVEGNDRVEEDGPEDIDRGGGVAMAEVAAAVDIVPSRDSRGLCPGREEGSYHHDHAHRPDEPRERENE